MMCVQSSVSVYTRTISVTTRRVNEEKTGKKYLPKMIFFSSKIKRVRRMPQQRQRNTPNEKNEIKKTIGIVLFTLLYTFSFCLLFHILHIQQYCFSLSFKKTVKNPNNNSLYMFSVQYTEKNVFVHTLLICFQ